MRKVKPFFLFLQKNMHGAISRSRTCSAGSYGSDGRRWGMNLSVYFPFGKGFDHGLHLLGGDAGQMIGAHGAEAILLAAADGDVKLIGGGGHIGRLLLHAVLLLKDEDAEFKGHGKALGQGNISEIAANAVSIAGDVDGFHLQLAVLGKHTGHGEVHAGSIAIEAEGFQRHVGGRFLILGILGHDRGGFGGGLRVNGGHILRAGLAMALGEAALDSGLLGHIRCGGNQAEGHEGAEEQGDELVRTFFHAASSLCGPAGGIQDGVTVVGNLNGMGLDFDLSGAILVYIVHFCSVKGDGGDDVMGRLLDGEVGQRA